MSKRAAGTNPHSTTEPEHTAVCTQVRPHRFLNFGARILRKQTELLKHSELNSYCSYLTDMNVDEKVVLIHRHTVIISVVKEINVQTLIILILMCREI